MSASWDPESPSLLPAIVCHADILGFRAMTRVALRSGMGREFLLRIKRALSAAYGKVRKARNPGYGHPPAFDMKVYTDNIVVAHPLSAPFRDHGEPELGTLLTLFAEVQSSLAADGFLLRGGIAAGLHYQDEEVVYGDALLEAVNLDKSGRSPRLVIGDSVRPLISKQLSSYGDSWWAPHYHHLLEDPRDGELCVNYLGVAFEHFPYGPIDWKLLEKHREKVLAGLSRYESDTRVWPKYRWAAVYHNYVCSTFAAQFPGRADGEGDPDQIAISSEAQRALDYLVPIEAPLEEQVPRQLDARRLRQRSAAI